MRIVALIVFAVFSSALFSGCASVISQKALKDVDRSITVAHVQSDPARYEGAKVLWGGLIVSSKNLEKTTVIEVLEHPFTYQDVPDTLAETRGRFLIKSPGYLDTLVYKPDMLITVAGVFKRLKSRKIGEMEYPYPVVAPIEMKLIKVYDPKVYEDSRYYDPWYDDPWYYDPWWGLPYPYYPYYDPFYDPWPRRGHRYRR